MNKEKNYEVILTLVVVLVFLNLTTHIKVLLTIAVVLGLAGLLFYSLSKYLSQAFLFASEIIGSVMPKILLSIVFIIFLIPISFLYKFKSTDPLRLKKKSKSNYFEHSSEFTKESFEKTW